MKKIVLVVLLLSACSFAANKPNTADYNVNVHVSASSLAGPDSSYPFLNVIIDGKNYQLLGDGRLANSKAYELLTLGDYKARLVTDQHSSAYESWQAYEFLFPDGRTFKFNVVGVSE
jgi:hypothetical protein